MRLRRLAVRNFRKLEGPVLLEGLGDGLTLVSGCNEEGKSTLLAALKAALFEHHKVGGAVREGMIPLRVAGVVPEVEVDFEVEGGRWALRKAFGRGGADLVCPAGRRYSGDAAEDQLRQLLAFERREGATKRRPEHHGLAALFWIDQGTTFGGFDTYAAVAKDRLSSAVAGELGALAGGAGAARLLTRVRERCDPFWTPTFKERGPLKEAADRCAQLEVEVVELRRRVAGLAQKENKLGLLREERRRATALDAVGQAVARRDEARRRLDALEALRQRAALARERLKAGQARLAQAEAAVVDRRRARSALVEEEAKLSAARTTLLERRDALAAAAAALEAAEAAEAQARAVVTACEEDRQRLERRRLASERCVELARLEAAASRIKAARAEIAAAEPELAANPVTQGALLAARKAQQRRDQAAAGLAAVATTVALSPAAGAADARIAGRALPAEAPLELTERTVLELPGWGSLAVVPGGSDIAARRSEARAAEEELARALRACGGVASVAEAERLLLERERLERTLEAARTRYQSALDGAGHASLDELRQRVRALVALVDGEPPASDAEALDPAAQARAEDALARARASAARAAASLRAAEAQFHERKAAATLAEQRGRDAEQTVSSARAELERALVLQSDADLEAAAAAAREERSTLADDLMHLDTELERADPETVAARLQVAAREVDQLEADAARRERTIIELESELRASGDEGPGERLRQKEEELEEARILLARTRGQARAWKLLHDELEQALRADRAALLAPVAQRLDPWLRRLFPEAATVLDPQTMAPSGLVRQGFVEPYGSLSLGTREQIAILVRLGVATLLAEREGEAPCLILDDPLVYADEGRFEIMKAILQRAAQDLQILILTCRPRDYFGLDACHLKLEECRAG
jgi:DNA repair exonuclease SbcCD ATPase subunit